MSDMSRSIKARIESSVQIVKSGSSPLLDIRERRLCLERMLSSLRKYSDAITAALYEELGRESYDSYICELLPLARCIKYLTKNIRSLTAERKAEGRWFTFPAKYSVVQEPYGVVFVNGCWNYPFLLALEPVCGAIAAGNRVILKLPVRVPRCAALINLIVDEVFENDEVICVRDELRASEIISLGCDYVFFTGSKEGAREVVDAAADRMIPVTLELGGKNPCIVDAGADISSAVKRIVWGKFINSGQSCIAPDYLVVHKSIKADFLNALSLQIRKKYGEFPLVDSGCCKVVDSFAYERLNQMSNSGRLIFGGEKDPQNKKISPTVLDQLDAENRILTEEVFGPLLGVVEFENVSELLKLLRNNPDPLAVYYFGGNPETVEQLKKGVRSGSLCINDCMIQFVNNSVPFGGIGRSGTGAYHGKLTFSMFSHSKTVVKQSSRFDLNLRYRGGKLKEKLIRYIFQH